VERSLRVAPRGTRGYGALRRLRRRLLMGKG
jgi:hypothetical protein